MVATELQKLLADKKPNSYTAKRNTETALIQITDLVTKHIDETADPMILLLDMSAAFESILHRKLIEFLLRLGDTSVIGITNQLLIAREFVIPNSEQVYTMTAGVPQGSALRPILFAGFIQIISCTKRLLVKFADDFTIKAEN